MHRKMTSNIQGSISINEFKRIGKHFRSVHIINDIVLLVSEHEFSLDNVKSIVYTLDVFPKDKLTITLNNGTIIVLFRSGYQQYDFRAMTH